MSESAWPPVTRPGATLIDLEASIIPWWPAPKPARLRVVAAAAGVGVLAGALLPGLERAGISVALCGLAAAVPVSVAAFQRGRAAGRHWFVGRIPLALGLIAVGLAMISALRASDWLVWGCALAGLCLGLAAALDVRRGWAVLGTLPLFALAMLRALPWVARATSGIRWTERLRSTRPWLVGAGIGTVCTLVVGALLASGDEAFRNVVIEFWPSIDLGLFPARALIFVATTGAMLGAVFAASTSLSLPEIGAGPRRRHPAEWLTPLVFVTGTIAAFLAVEASALFAGANLVQSGSRFSHADRAREGFGQLTVVTLIVLVLLAWAGHAASAGVARDRWLMGGFGGILLVLALLLGVSALRRLWLYQEAYGWTVTRFNAGAFELWVAVVLIGVGLGWLFGRTDVLARFVVGSAGLGLLVVGVLGPDAVVAQANLDRFQSTGNIDLPYLRSLSADAVPVFDRQADPMRDCLLADRPPVHDPWFGWNLSRSRADALLEARPPGPSRSICFSFHRP